MLLRSYGGKARSNRCDLSNFRNVKIVSALRIGTGRAFYKAGQDMEKALDSVLVFIREQQIYLNVNTPVHLLQYKSMTKRPHPVQSGKSDRQGSNFESCVWRAVSSQSSHHPQEVLLAQFSLYVHKGGLKPDSFHFQSGKVA